MSAIKIVCPHCSAVNTLETEVSRKELSCTSCGEILNQTTPIECNEEMFKIHLSENEIPVLVDFFSPDCAPCMRMSDDYESAAAGFALEIRYLKVNTLEHPDIARQYGVNALPTIVAFKNNREVNRFSSALSKDQLKMWSESLIQMVL